MKNTTDYFRNEVLRKRPYLTIEQCRLVLSSPDNKSIQLDGRIRFWKKLEYYEGRTMRVVTLEDGKTIHNAFLDRSYKGDEKNETKLL